MRSGIEAAIAVIALLLAGCSDQAQESGRDPTIVWQNPTPLPRAYPSDEGDPEDHAYPATFHGVECSEDCSGHEAGYEWAEENEITDPSDCGGNSDSFREGCEIRVDESSE